MKKKLASVTHRELQELYKEYLSTLRDDDHDELYTTSKGFAETGIRPFLRWLRGRMES